MAVMQEDEGIVDVYVQSTFWQPEEARVQLSPGHSWIIVTAGTVRSENEGTISDVAYCIYTGVGVCRSLTVNMCTLFGMKAGPASTTASSESGRSGPSHDANNGELHRWTGIDWTRVLAAHWAEVPRPP